MVLIITERWGFCERHASVERTQSKAHDKFCGGGKASQLMPCVLGAQRRGLHKHEEVLGRGKSEGGRVYVEGKRG